ncbi:MAG: hypothetical protein K2Q22_11955, partial [Cytophagales bacterium]|nr:hypothetical protein [Cytophagales bacterium]
MKNRLLKYGLLPILIVFILGFAYMYFEIRKFEKSDLQNDRGFGSTSIKLKVLDFESEKPIDSVRLTIRYGVSAERLVDTLLGQKDSIFYNFIVPEADDYESYWVEVSNKLYWDELYFKDTSQNSVLLKGMMNEKTIFLKPSTKIKVTLSNKIKVLNRDTVYLFFERKDKKDFQVWDYFTQENFKKRKTISAFYNLESGLDYKAMWIHKNVKSSDTLYHEFYT